MIGRNLLGIPETRIPENPELIARYDAGDEAEDLVRQFPAEQLPWALMAEDAAADGRDIEAYAFARVGYHRGLDALRRAGWKGQGPVPYLSLIHISEPTRLHKVSRMPSSA